VVSIDLVAIDWRDYPGCDLANEISMSPAGKLPVHVGDGPLPGCRISAGRFYCERWVDGGEVIVVDACNDITWLASFHPPEHPGVGGTPADPANVPELFGLESPGPLTYKVVPAIRVIS
jgi:hypothetical protein